MHSAPSTPAMPVSNNYPALRHCPSPLRLLTHLGACVCNVLFLPFSRHLLQAEASVLLLVGLQRTRPWSPRQHRSLVGFTLRQQTWLWYRWWLNRRHGENARKHTLERPLFLFHPSPLFLLLGRKSFFFLNGGLSNSL